jgi:multimeric flavodoxin WrbA
LALFVLDFKGCLKKKEGVSMKILALAGIPRQRRNSDLLLEASLEGARGKGAETEKVYLTDLELHWCRACYSCHRTCKCRQKDDMRKLYPKLLDADAWVIATPVYWWGPSAQTKTALDRIYCLCFGPHPKKIRGKKAVLITTSEDLPKRAAVHVAGMMRKSFDYLEMEFAGRLMIQAHQKGEVANMPAVMKRARALGKKIATM